METLVSVLAQYPVMYFYQTAAASVLFVLLHGADLETSTRGTHEVCKKATETLALH